MAIATTPTTATATAHSAHLAVKQALPIASAALSAAYTAWQATGGALPHLPGTTAPYTKAAGSSQTALAIAAWQAAYAAAAPVPPNNLNIPKTRPARVAQAALAAAPANTQAAKAASAAAAYVAAHNAYVALYAAYQVSYAAWQAANVAAAGCGGGALQQRQAAKAAKAYHACYAATPVATPVAT